MRSRRKTLAALLTAALSTAGVPATCAGQDRSDAPSDSSGDTARKEARKGDQESVPLYTNADLDRLFAEDRAAEPSKAQSVQASGMEKGEGVDALKAIQQEQATLAGRRVQIAEAERGVKDLETTVQNLETRALAVRNPYLPRPRLSPEEAKAWEGLSGPERLKVTLDQLEQAKKDLQGARDRLENLRVGP